MPLKNPWRGLWLNHKVTQQQYEVMLNAQEYRCAICLRHESDCARKSKHGNRVYQIILHVDHDHDTGMVRGLLCHQCNTMLGYAREKCQVLQNAISYLQKHTACDALQPVTATNGGSLIQTTQAA